MRSTGVPTFQADVTTQKCTDAVDNHSNVNDVSMEEHKVEREDGVLSPTECFEL